MKKIGTLFGISEFVEMLDEYGWVQIITSEGTINITKAMFTDFMYNNGSFKHKKAEITISENNIRLEMI